MGEFTETTKKRAAETLSRTFQQGTTAGVDPVLELTGFLLEDGAGGVVPQPEAPVTTEQWLLWNQLALEQPEELIEAMTSVLDEEEMELPQEPEAMRTWAASLLLKTLDQMGML
jgi:hypothetical protein